MKRSLALAGIPLALLLAACGTTVPLTSGAQVGTGAGTTGGLAPVGQGSTGLVAPGTTGTQPGAPVAGGTTGAVSGSTTGATGSVTGGTTGAAVAPGRSGRGYTATTLTVGIPNPTGEEAFAGSLGISGASTSIPVKRAVSALVNDINRTGGVLGRKLQVYYHEFDTAAYFANTDQVTNEICTDFRDDHHVFAVFFTIPTQQLRECLATMGTPLIGGSGGVGVVPAKSYDYRGGSYFYAPNAITTERLATLFIESLMERDFHQKWDSSAGQPGGVAPVKIGAIHADSADTNALYDAYETELKKHGLKYTDHVTYAANVQAGLAATQNAVLKFRADGITHVYGASAFFLQAAENQGYRPRYAYIPGLGALGAANVPARQMRGAMTVGWTPTSDVNPAQDPGERAGTAACRAVMLRAGLRPQTRTDFHTIYSVCDLLYSFKAAATAGGAPSVEGLRRGFESLGGSFKTALTFNALLGPRRHYGVDSVRDMAWDTSCTCLRYTSRTDRR